MSYSEENNNQNNSEELESAQKNQKKVQVLSFAAEPGDIINTLEDGPSLFDPSLYATQLTSNDEGLTFQAFAYCLNNPSSGGGGTGD